MGPDEEAKEIQIDGMPIELHEGTLTVYSEEYYEKYGFDQGAGNA